MVNKPKKIKKIMTVQVPKAEVPNAVENIIGSLVSLQASAGWAIVVKILNDNIVYLEKAILEGIDPDSKELLTDADIDILRTKRGLNIELRDTPANFVKVIKDTGTVPVEYDPYFKTNDEIMKARQNANQDDPGKR